MQESFVRRALLSGLILLGAAPVYAQLTIAYPNSTDATIQDAVNRAGCGGTVVLAAGTYTATELSTVTGPNYGTGHIHLACGGRLIGAGVGRTVVDGTNSPGDAPVIGLGNDGRYPSTFTSGYELSHMTIVADPASPFATQLAVGIGWARDVSAHHLSISGFANGVVADLASDTEIHHVTAVGRGVADTRGIEFRELGLFNQLLTPAGHMTGNSIHHNTVSHFGTGIALSNNEAPLVYQNVSMNSRTGADMRGVHAPDFHHNLVGKNTLRGLNLRYTIDGSFHDNVLCENATALRFAPRNPTVVFGFGASIGNVFHHDQRLGYGIEAVNDDPGSPSAYTESHITSDAAGVCPAQ